jgi:hypothetical protein
MGMSEAKLEGFLAQALPTPLGVVATPRVVTGHHT